MEDQIKKHPCHLPGKEISSHHYIPEAAWKLPKKEKQKEILPLLSLAEKRGWTKSPEKILDLLEKDDVSSLWKITKEWGTKIAWAQPEESPAGAGWLLIKNWHRAQTKKKQFEAPYPGLLSPDPETLLNAKNYFPHDSPEQDRLTLAVILRVIPIPNLTLQGMGREAVGADAVEKTGMELLRSISHGVPTTHNWKHSPLPTVKNFIQNLEYQLPPGWKNAIKKTLQKP